MDANKEIKNEDNEIEGKEVEVEEINKTENKEEISKVKDSEKKKTNEEEKEEEEEEEDDKYDEKLKIILKDQKVIIELNDDLKNHIKNKNFKLDKKLTYDFEFI